MALDLHDLLIFFGSEPKIDESDVPWDYSGAQITFESGDDLVWCRLAPGEGELALVWCQGGVKRVELSLEGYFDVKIENTGGEERLVALPQTSDRRPLVLRLRPQVFIAIGAV
ncbi:MAG: hypothetical protein Q7K57_36875 [Burkholderiaceae bacterium]|nr:hypothetical protein [Burkholderiaceae bacterium]